MNDKQQNRIGITGGIGSGKTYVCRMIESMGYPVYYCDDRAKQLMLTDTTIREQLVSLLGNEAYTADGLLNRTVVANYLFASASNAARINAIVHPAVKRDFLRWSDAQSSEYVFLESAIIYEAGFQDVVHKVVLVTAPLDVRIERVMQRDATTRTKVQERIRSQMTDEEKQRLADIVIVNDGESPLKLENIFC